MGNRSEIMKERKAIEDTDDSEKFVADKKKKKSETDEYESILLAIFLLHFFHRFFRGNKKRFIIEIHIHTHSHIYTIGPICVDLLKISKCIWAKRGVFEIASTDRLDDKKRAKRTWMLMDNDFTSEAICCLYFAPKWLILFTLHARLTKLNAFLSPVSHFSGYTFRYGNETLAFRQHTAVEAERAKMTIDHFSPLLSSHRSQSKSI